MHNNVKKRFVVLTDRLGEEAEISTFESFFLQMDHAGILSIKGCNEISDYFSDKIILDSPERRIELSGTDLFIKCFAPQETLIVGKIDMIRFL